MLELAVALALFPSASKPLIPPVAPTALALLPIAMLARFDAAATPSAMPPENPPEPARAPAPIAIVPYPPEAFSAVAFSPIAMLPPSLPERAVAPLPSATEPRPEAVVPAPIAELRSLSADAP
ncbi:MULTISPECIES: hypothetical protein [Burkholderia cepacia complex]|uniref:hypothetical protein n=1 Tax=Burkholderia cenocepacia TaxID=95486 RepID=UPI001E3F823A|nr:hypothetical protein [Burkholderia cenocepacia]